MSEKITIPLDLVAIKGPLKTENLGIEKIVANIISNPNIRYLILYGREIRGHKSGATLLALWKYGIDKNNRIINAPGAVPYIENLSEEAIERFRRQIKIINMLESTDQRKLLYKIEELYKTGAEPFGDPYIAIKIENTRKTNLNLQGSLGLHKTIIVDAYGDIKPLETN